MPGKPTHLLDRIFRSLRRLPGASLAAARRRPRRTIVLALALVAALGVGTASLLTAARPAGSSEPTFTSRVSWTLAELERHVAAGEVDAITAAPAPNGGVAALHARLTDGRVVPITLSVGAADAVAALSALGHGNLLTTEAVGVGRPATGSINAVAIAVSLSLLSVLMFMVWRISRRRPGGRDRKPSFMTILPPARATATADAGGLGSGSASGAPAVVLADVAGCDEAKLELTETIEFLHTPNRFRKLGARIPRGIMLYGPPGTGKTMLARAVAAEAGVPFHYASGSEFVEKYVGVGAKRIRELFAQARKLGRGVIFFDEFDAIGKARGGPNSHEEREQTLNQLLVELDGFSTTEDVIVIAATNRLDILDSAVLRPGRFNRKIHVGMPDVKGRRAILDVHARNKPLDATTDLDELARKTYGFSGAMLADLLNEAAIMTARREAEAIAPDDLHAGWLKVAVGTSRRRSMDERERSIIAAHEIGHAICGRVHGDKRKVEEISLFAHGEALGVTVSSQEDNDLPSESDLRSRLVALMGGRAAEEILFHEVTGGASNDFEAANRIATNMVTKWGMGHDPEDRDGGISGRGVLSFFVPAAGNGIPSEIKPAATRAIRAILDEAYAEASRTLVANLDTLRRLAAYLVEHERVDGQTFDELWDGRRDVANATDEWRAATSRPRAWGDVVDLADRRMRREPGSAASGRAEPLAPSSEPVEEPLPSVAAVTGSHDAREQTPEPTSATAITSLPAEGAAPPTAGTTLAAQPAAFAATEAPAYAAGVQADHTGDRVAAPDVRALTSSPTTAGLRIVRPGHVRRVKPSSTRRVRRTTAGLLRRVGQWIQPAEVEVDRS
jgi:cell division protease FtsH